jgi:hypothetical protein
MPFLLTSAFLLFIAYPMIGTTAVIWVLAASQLVLLIGEIKRGQVTGAGGFIFLSFLFFSIRPIYLFLEKDHKLLLGSYLIRPTPEILGNAMWWASVGLFFFALGVYAAPRIQRAWLQRHRAHSMRVKDAESNSTNVIAGLLGLQLASLPTIYLLASRFGRGVYRSELGAYFYDFPVLLQALHVFAVVFILHCWLRNRALGPLIALCISGVLFLLFTWLMRDVTIFRGVWLTAIMIVGIAAMQLWSGRAGYAWLILPIILLQPLFQHLGSERGKSNEELVEEGVISSDVVEDDSLAESYWNFYRSNGDMNIFDTFVAANESEPKWHPYAWSWAYVPFHFIPRFLWAGKPKRGVTQDLSFLRGFPTSPGIAGFFLADGGRAWMLLSMFVLGYLVSLADWYVLTMRRGVLQSCILAILVVTGMYLSRVFLWQYFYQVLYYLIPILVLNWWVSRMSAGPARSRGRVQRPLPRTPLAAGG